MFAHFDLMKRNDRRSELLDSGSGQLRVLFDTTKTSSYLEVVLSGPGRHFELSGHASLVVVWQC